MPSLTVVRLEPDDERAAGEFNQLERPAETILTKQSLFSV
jgi:hypothetical protein